jgi:hypothetical protein
MTLVRCEPTITHMLTRNFLKLLLVAIVGLTIAAFTSNAQIVSSGMTGTVLDATGAPVSGARVTAVHTPTNTKFTGTTGANGRFSFRGMPVGGPYSVSAEAEGHSINPLTSIETTLGQETDVELSASTEIVTLETMVTSASRTDLDANATGSSSVLSSRRIEVQPTVARSFADLMKTNPFVSLRSGQQAQALGTNSRFNNIMLDGAKINDSFGLSSSGLASITNPFSLDAIEQVNISLTPYDIRQSGSTGLYMNVVSKSGTNEFGGSAYYIFTEDKWQGKDLVGTTQGQRPVYKQQIYGFTFGGPIIRDRLFFFLNFERDFSDAAGITPNFTPSAAFLSGISARAANLPGTPDFGEFGATGSSPTYDTKRLAKLDWNITDDHRLSVRYSDTDDARPNTTSANASNFSGQAIPGQPTSFPNSLTALSSNFYILPVLEEVWAAQLFSNWTDALKSQLRYSHTKQNSLRQTPIIFPEIRIFNVPNDTGTITNGNGIRLGTELSSMGNGGIVTTETMGGSADYTWKSFTLTGGADHEKSDFINFFRQGSYGVFAYNNIDDFQADRPFGFYRAVVKNGLEIADISSFEQTGVFGQVRWDPSWRFNLTLGVRVDYIGAPVAVPYNAGFASAFGMTNAGSIDDTTVPAPRISFNFALDRERMTQIRGGIGVFMGRNPWVWISNSYGNFGVGRFTVTKFLPNNTVNTAAYTGPTLTQYLNGTYSDTDVAYKFDSANPIGRTDITPSATTIQTINLMKPGLKLPTVQRGNIAIDRKLPFLDAVASLEYIHTKQTTALFIDNMNLRPTTKGIDGRQLFAGTATAAPIVPGFGDVLRVRDVEAGTSNAVGIVLERPMKSHWAYSVAYTRTDATEAQSLGSSTAGSNWRFNPVFNQNQVEVARSDYEVRDRVQVSLSREFRFKKDFVTTVSLYYEGRSGMPYSYVYNNDINRDGFGGNDLVAVPTGEDDARFDFSGMTAIQRTAYFDHLKSSGLSAYAGGSAPRNAFLTPWQNRLDLRVVQDIPLGTIPRLRKAKLQVFADFLNFGAWVNKDFFNYIELLNSAPSNGGQTRSLGAATYDPTTGKIRPTFQDGNTTVLSLDGNNALVFGPNVPVNLSTSASVIRPNSAESRWKIQAGVRVLF